MAASARKRMARQAMKASGVTLKRLARTTGTTKNEVRGLYNATARRLATGGVSKSDTAALRRALSGGPMAGVSSQPKLAKNLARTVRQTFKQMDASNVTANHVRSGRH